MSADNVSLPASAAARHAAALLLLSTGHATIDQHLLLAGPAVANPQQQHRVWWPNDRTDRQANGWTDTCPTVTQTLLCILCRQWQ